ncbi:serine peptidase [Massilia phosphatilytica]|nr:serine peptidase [Massilia phosphatilytica]
MPMTSCRYASPLLFACVLGAAHAAEVGPDFSALVEKAGPAVVNIRTTRKVAERDGDDAETRELFRRFFGEPLPRDHPPLPPDETPERVRRGVGSGFIVSRDGEVLTNAHVVDGADEVFVKLADRREFKARVVGTDRRTDVAVLKIAAAGLPTLTTGDSGNTKAGEWVIAIGSPFDLDNTVTAGIVSARARETGDFLPLIQTDVPVNPGNSGGPLINLRGEVVGINSQIYSRSGGFMGISFAIPIADALRVAGQLKGTGHVTRGRLGVYLTDVDRDVADALGLARTQGGFVGRVERGGPAERAGLRDGDIIMAFNGAVVERSAQLRRLAADTRPGTTVDLTVWRNGAARHIDVTLAELEAERPAPKAQPKAAPAAPGSRLGVSVLDLTAAQKAELGARTGVVVDKVDGAAQQAGLRPGDIILALDNADVASAAAFAQQAGKAADKSSVLLVRRGDTSQLMLLRPAP